MALLGKATVAKEAELGRQMIDIVVPVLNRPANAQPLVDSIKASTKVPHTIRFMISPFDWLERAACQETGAELTVVEWEPGPGDATRKWNLGYTFGEFPFVLLAADDLEFEPNWDVAALKQADRTGKGVIGTNDQANPLVRHGKHSTHPLVRREYIDTVGGTWHDGPGIVYHAGYSHQFVETELVNAAMQRDQWAFAMMSVVRHMHPMYPHKGRPRTAMDETYKIAMADGRDDMVIYRQRAARAGATPVS